MSGATHLGSAPSTPIAGEGDGVTENDAFILELLEVLFRTPVGIDQETLVQER